MENELYTYKAFCTSVFDGDTITCDIQLGFNTVMKDQKIRLYGINTPEIRTGTEGSKAEAKEVRDWLRRKICGEYFILKSYRDKKGKYGRWLGIIYKENENINEILIKQGYDAEY